MECSGTYSVNRVFSGLAVHCLVFQHIQISVFSLCPLPLGSACPCFQKPSTSWRRRRVWNWRSLGYVLNGSSTVRYLFCASTCTLANGVQLLFLDQGLYSGIFVMYLKCQSDKSRKATIVFYALCLLHVLSTATVVSDLVISAIQFAYMTGGPVSYDSIC